MSDHDQATGLPHESLIALLRRLAGYMDARRKRQYGLLAGLMFAAAFAELVSIGSVLPFLTALLQPQVILDNAVAKRYLAVFGVTRREELIVMLTATFAVATLVACGVRLGLLWCSTRLTFAFGSDVGNRLYGSILSQSYAVHVARNSSEVLDAIATKVSELIFYVLLPVVQLSGAVIVAGTICIALVLTIPATALIAMTALIVMYAVIIKVSRQRLRVNSVRIARGSTQIVKTLQEGLGGIRDILLDNTQAHFAGMYRAVNADLRRAQGDNQIIGMGPRYILEATGMLLIAALAYLLTLRAGGEATAIPLLAAIALGLQRLLPAAQQVFSAWSTIHGGQASLRDIVVMLAQMPQVGVGDDAGGGELSFCRTLRFRGVSFRHTSEATSLFENLDLTIRKGATVGFIGETGSGKSTLLDIAMGLLEPTSGSLEVDDVVIDERNRRAWQRHIAHVPQSVFLADCSIEENIAFGVPNDAIDHERVRRAASRAQLAKVIDTWPQAYRTRVGERGVQLSGGQRQRIGIARALYKNADVIVFDEATSALDGDTEKAVMDGISALGDDITVLIIAHRLNTLRGCSEIVRLGHGKILERYSDVAAVTATVP